MLTLHESPTLEKQEHIDPASCSPLTSAANAKASLPPLQGLPYRCVSGVLAAEAVDVLKRFYARGNQSLPMERRHRKGQVAATSPAPLSADSSVAVSSQVESKKQKR